MSCRARQCQFHYKDTSGELGINQSQGTSWVRSQVHTGGREIRYNHSQDQEPGSRFPDAMDTDLSSQDRKDLDKFIKFFALKTVQVIVQARLGEKICTRSSSSPTGSDWFNLAIKDIPEVTHEAKKALAGQLPAVGRSMCVEISLKTSEGDSMELEIWCLEMNEKHSEAFKRQVEESKREGCFKRKTNPHSRAGRHKDFLVSHQNRCDKEIKVSYTVYNRLSLLLKSLLAITRVTPAYRLSRKQGHEYVILYRIYFGEVQLSGLGEGFQTVRVGTVGTPLGTITLSCAYRINLAFMSTRQFERTPPIMGIIIDHFVDRPYPSSSPMHPCNYRAAGEENAVAYPSVEDSQETCTASSTSPPSQCVFTVTKAHFQTPPPVVMDMKGPVMGLAFSHQRQQQGDKGPFESMQSGVKIGLGENVRWCWAFQEHMRQWPLNMNVLPQRYTVSEYGSST
ncbi:autophagy-related protein 13 isoform X11 [Hemicordylus capensis]|uniref:autophagy-related protein 13 isoform X11 n=1 Tax=Hemicordylus capensis TaxID=884348 RepID=UPI002302CF8F|nr:autophagy-related protein 13 isoform X11 [Hemicordylus capensis]